MLKKNFLCATLVLVALTAASCFVLPSQAYAHGGDCRYDNYCRGNYSRSNNYCGNSRYRSGNYGYYGRTKHVGNTQHNWLWPLPSAQRPVQSQVRYYHAHNRTGYVHTTHPRHYSRPSRR